MSWSAATRGQSEVLGFACLLGMVVLGTTSILLLGGSALDQTQSTAEVSRAEQTMTLFDSRAAMVALGETDTQVISLRGHDSEYRVDANVGWLRITHTNHSDSGDTEVIYNRSLGSVVYDVGDTEVAYQGGGVWRRDGSDNATLVSPPEFHYRGATLTLPVIRVTKGAVTGTERLRVDRATSTERIYPNDTATYNNTSRGYTNPATNGTITVTVKSEYYAAWAKYLRSRTDGRVTVFHGNQTARVTLLTVGNRGSFQMPPEGEDLSISGLSGGGHSLEDLSFRLVGDQGSNDDLESLQWSMYFGDDPDELHQFELYLKADGDGFVKAVVYYSDDNGDTYAGWKNEDAFAIQRGDVDGDGDDEDYVDVDFTGDTVMTYTSLSKSDTNVFDPQQGTLMDPHDWDQHAGVGIYRNGSVVQEAETFTAGDTSRIDNVTSHYTELLPDEFELTVKDGQAGRGGGSGAVDESASSGTIQYPGASKFITYLHVTDDEVRVEFD